MNNSNTPNWNYTLIISKSAKTSRWLKRKTCPIRCFKNERNVFFTESSKDRHDIVKILRQHELDAHVVDGIDFGIGT